MRRAHATKRVAEAPLVDAEARPPAAVIPAIWGSWIAGIVPF